MQELSEPIRKRLYLIAVFVLAIIIILPACPPEEVSGIEVISDIEAADTYTKITRVNDYIICDEGVYLGTETTVMQVLMPLPASILTTFIDDGWVIEVTSEIINDEMNGDCAALYEPNEKKIYVHQEHLAGILHEMGHFFDAKMHPGTDTKLSNSDEWIRAYINEQTNLELIDSSTKNNSYNEAEAFAEVFRLTMQGTDISDSVPSMQKWMQIYLARIQN